MPFIAVDDVEGVRCAVAEACGKVMADGELEDPHGARFVVWDGAYTDGAPHGLNRPGGLAWNEVRTPDVEATVAFYRRIIGWNRKEQPSAGGVYTMFAGRDRPSWTHGGVVPLGAGGSASRWLSYFEVTSCAQSVETARRLGAAITMGATRVPGVGWIATAVDGEGAAFGLMQSGG
jgi:predicted enzyme related to lactoylglutathione lyase